MVLRRNDYRGRTHLLAGDQAVFVDVDKFAVLVDDLIRHALVLILGGDDQARIEIVGRRSVLELDARRTQRVVPAAVGNRNGLDVHLNFFSDGQFERCRNSVNCNRDCRFSGFQRCYDSLGADRGDLLVRRIIAFGTVRGVLGKHCGLSGKLQRSAEGHRVAVFPLVGQRDRLHGYLLDREGELGRLAVDGDRDRRFADGDRRYEALFADQRDHRVRRIVTFGLVRGVRRGDRRLAGNVERCAEFQRYAVGQFGRQRNRLDGNPLLFDLHFEM